MINFETILERLQEMFPNQPKSEVEQYIESNNPKNPGDVEYLIQQWNYSKQKSWGLQ